MRRFRAVSVVVTALAGVLVASVVSAVSASALANGTAATPGQYAFAAKLV